MRTSIIFIIIFFCISAVGMSATLKVPSQFPTIQDAIDAASGGDTVLVAPGTYVENIDFKGKAITVMGEKGPDVSVIDGNMDGSVVKCISGEGPDSVLDGFTITNGATDWGGGMSNVGSSPTVTNCVFIGNSYGFGAGMLNQGGNPTVTNCKFTENYGDVGGGMFNLSSNPTVTNCIFTGNEVYAILDGSGGGMSNDNSSPKITNCIFSGNKADCYGGGMCNWNYSSPTVTNCTFTGNSAYEGGGMCNLAFCSPTVTNCILWDNTPDEIYGTATVSYSDVKGGWPGTGNIDSDPLFVDPANGDFHLTFNSPCRGSGDNTAVIELADFEGDPRIYQGTVDMGADEFHAHLYYTGDAIQGGNVEIKFVGLPGISPVCLCVGTGVLDPPLPSMWGDWYLKFPIFGPIDMPSIPSPAGVLIIPATIPASPPAPYSIPMQALIGTELTNLSVLEVK